MHLRLHCDHILTPHFSPLFICSLLPLLPALFHTFDLTTVWGFITISSHIFTFCSHMVAFLLPHLSAILPGGTYLLLRLEYTFSVPTVIPLHSYPPSALPLPQAHYPCYHVPAEKKKKKKKKKKGILHIGIICTPLVATFSFHPTLTHFALMCVCG